MFLVGFLSSFHIRNALFISYWWFVILLFLSSSHNIWFGYKGQYYYMQISTQAFCRNFFLSVAFHELKVTHYIVFTMSIIASTRQIGCHKHCKNKIKSIEKSYNRSFPTKLYTLLISQLTIKQRANDSWQKMRVFRRLNELNCIQHFFVFTIQIQRTLKSYLQFVCINISTSTST